MNNKAKNILCVIESGSWIYAHIVGSLREAGHTVHVFYYGDGVGEFYGRVAARGRQEKNNSLLELASELTRSSGLDLIFCYVYDDFLLPETAKALARLALPMVNYNVDMVSQWYRQSRTAKYFTRILCAQRDNMSEMARYNPRVLYFPMAGRRGKAHADFVDFTPAAPVTFMGSPNPYRAALLARVHEAGIPLALYGKYWQEGEQTYTEYGLEKTTNDLFYYSLPKLRAEGFKGLFQALERRIFPTSAVLTCDMPRTLFHGFVPEGALDLLFRRSAINLGFTRMTGDDPDRPGKTQLKLRDFEVPLAGGFYLVERVPEYEGLFASGVEVETWGSWGELIDKIRYYLDHPEQRQRIAEAGRQRAEREHTWENRFEMLFADLGITR